MEISDAIRAFEAYDVLLFVAGLAVLATAVLPRLLADKPLTLPLLLVAMGFVTFSLPGIEPPDPLADADLTERLTELGVIVALMGAGLAIDRPFAWRDWSVTWRLLLITMPLTVGLTALLGWWFVGLVPAAAVLLGAVVSPTDPVLASEVQVGGPGQGAKDEETGGVDPALQEEDEVRFALTSEAGLNDGLAFPYTNMAVAMAIAGAAPAGWIEAWLVVDVAMKLGLGLLLGWALGRACGEVILRFPARTHLGRAMSGLGALAATLLVYGATEFLGGYGFLAVFVAAVSLRNNDREHDYHEALHILIEKAERLLMAGIMLLLGGAIAGGLLEPLSWQMAVLSVLLVFVIRPALGLLGLLGVGEASRSEKLAIAFFGIRGIGSLYYLAYAVEHAEFEGEAEVWALVAFVVLLSVVVHGITASPVTNWLDRQRVKNDGA